MRHLFIILLLLSHYGAAHAASLVLEEPQPTTDLALHLDYWLNERGELSLEQVERAYQQGRFQRNNTTPLTLPRSVQGLWIRFELHNPSQHTLHRALTFRRTLYDTFIFQEESLSHSKRTVRGYTSFNNKQKLAYDHNRLRIEIQPQESVSYYLYIEDSLSLNAGITLSSLEAANENLYFSGILHGSGYVIMLAMAIYNLFLFFSLRYRSYLSYVAYILILLLFLATHESSLYMLSWFSWPQWGVQQQIFVVCLAAASAANFNQHFLRLKKHTPLLSNLISLCKALLVILALTCLLNIRSLDQSLSATHNMINLALAPLMLIASVKALLQGNRQARFFLLAWLPLLSVTFVSILAALGYIKHSPITLYGIHITAALEAIILSFGLADRINNLKHQRDSAQLNSVEQDIKLHEERLKRSHADACTRFLAHMSAQSNAKDLFSELSETVMHICAIDHVVVLHYQRGYLNQYDKHSHDERVDTRLQLKLPLLEEAVRSQEALLLHSSSEDSNESSQIAVIPLFSRQQEWAMVICLPNQSEIFEHSQLRDASKFSHLIKEQLLNNRQFYELRNSIEYDALTGTLSHGALMRFGQRSLIQRHKFNQGVCIVLLHVEQNHQSFVYEQEKINEQLQVNLVRLSQGLLNESDLLGRYSDSEFIALLPGQGVEVADAFIQEINQQLCAYVRERYDNVDLLSLSCAGVYSEDGQESLAALINQAQSQLQLQSTKLITATAPLC